jgi:hypothetical protein
LKRRIFSTIINTIRQINKNFDSWSSFSGDILQEALTTPYFNSTVPRKNSIILIDALFDINIERANQCPSRKWMETVKTLLIIDY